MRDDQRPATSDISSQDCEVQARGLVFTEFQDIEVQFTEFQDPQFDEHETQLQAVCLGQPCLAQTLRVDKHRHPRSPIKIASDCEP